MLFIKSCKYWYTLKNCGGKRKKFLFAIIIGVFFSCFHSQFIKTIFNFMNISLMLLEIEIHFQCDWFFFATFFYDNLFVHSFINLISLITSFHKTENETIFFSASLACLVLLNKLTPQQAQSITNSKLPLNGFCVL